MNFNPKEEINELLTLNKEIGLRIDCSGNHLMIEKQRNSWEFIYWLVLIIGIPAYYILTDYSIKGLIIMIALAFAFIYLIYNSLLASNSLVFDLDKRILAISPRKWIYKKERRLLFDEIKNVSLEQKSFGRGQRPGRRLNIETTHGQIISAVDFRSVSLAETVEKFLKNRIFTNRTT
ncbi:PH domain-containing protein [Adhaeribacter pallidiroseus]|uniref:DUF304 domain-containing protein n=1 Tax=Adhaeribacter pallidiroseus TaxID=2072847 RepID=A0A369QDI1_9BACT|nr:PH domain-containing protein [Adhaeribacter pallidiroseus]RDC62764.1 hypothetical protein AHMF7616_01358 [Adhaeribacter pallidiroseus]